MQRAMLFYAYSIRLMYTKIEMITYQTDTLKKGNKRMLFSFTEMKMKLLVIENALL